VSMCEMEAKKVEFILVIHIALSILPFVQCEEVCEIHATIIRRVENEGFHR
jgi:hypothetical protein